MYFPQNINLNKTGTKSSREYVLIYLCQSWYLEEEKLLTTWQEVNKYVKQTIYNAMGTEKPRKGFCFKPSFTYTKDEQKRHGQTYRTWIYTTVQEKYIIWTQDF